MTGNPHGLPVNQSTMLNALKNQLGVAVRQSRNDVWRFGIPWQYGDTTSYGAGLSVLASELYYLTQASGYNTYSQQWLAIYSASISGDGRSLWAMAAHSPTAFSTKWQPWRARSMEPRVALRYCGALLRKARRVRPLQAHCKE